MSKKKESRASVIKRPYKVASHSPQKGWRKLPDNIINRFFTENHIENYRSKIGVYVFSRKHGRSYTPVYVGKSVNSFEAEIFNCANRLTYNDAMMEMTGSFVVFLIMPSDIAVSNSWSSDTKVVSFRREDEIDAIETFFILAAKKVNSKLKNKQKIKDPEWHIDGVIRGETKRGIKKTPIPEFKKMMGL